VSVELIEFVRDFAKGIKLADSRRPVAISQRSKITFQAGIGPHSEAAAIRLVMNELRALDPANYAEYRDDGVSYPNMPGQKCDLCLGVSPKWRWCIEAKLLRLLGDNGKPNDNMLMHILSPYAQHRSAFTDCSKLLASGLEGRKAIVVFGFDHNTWPLDPAIEALEVLAKSRVNLGPRCEAEFQELVHPVHVSGRVFAWELMP
jgi:hypothetical protein